MSFDKAVIYYSNRMGKTVVKLSPFNWFGTE